MSGHDKRSGLFRQGYSRKAEKEAQARSKVPVDVAGCDYIARGSINWEVYRSEHDRIFGKKTKETKHAK